MNRQIIAKGGGDFTVAAHSDPEDFRIEPTSRTPVMVSYCFGDFEWERTEGGANYWPYGGNGRADGEAFMPLDELPENVRRALGYS